jgi:lysyl-tRNA synthetase class 2
MADAVFENKRDRFLELRGRGELRDAFPKDFDLAALRKQPEGKPGLRTAGRIVAKRRMGKIIFAQLYDFSGRIQIYLQRDESSEGGSKGCFESFLDDAAVGDFVGVEGDLFTTKTGELTLRVHSWTMLNKSLRTLPEKFHGITDQETIYRKRYLDIITSDESRLVFHKRIQIVRALRRYLEDSDFLEVETPVLQNQASGAMARPFNTHHNSLGIDCVLRIAPETYLKRCIGAGMDRVFEFARCFRNEGISASHLQDFTMLEFYAAYWNAEVMRGFVAGMIRNLVETVFGSVTVTLSGHSVDFGGNWQVVEYCDLILRDSGIDIRVLNTREALLAALHSKGLHLEDEEKSGFATLVDLLYKKVSRPKLIQPTFIVGYPRAMAPLARRSATNPEFVDLFQFVVAGVELVKAYSELVDPLEQRERFEEQATARDAGDEETMATDEDFLLAMEHGFPPIAGVGIGIDRLTMILCGCENIKDTVLFPLMRPHREGQHAEAEGLEGAGK